MFKQGKECLKGHRMEFVIIRCCICICWLIPIATEMIVRRFVPNTVLWHTVTLGGSYLLNRILIAPAYTGYYACCRRLAAATVKTAVTSQIGDLHEEMIAPTLLKCFFLDYRHPLKTLQWQLRWDGLRALLFFICVFPAFCFVAIGAREEQWLLQAVCFGGGLLCGLFGSVCAYLLICRWRPALFYRPQYAPFHTVMCNAWQKSRHRTAKALLLCVKLIAFTPLRFVPFVSFRVQKHIEEAVMWVTAPAKPQKARIKIFHTRVLYDA